MNRCGGYILEQAGAPFDADDGFGKVPRRELALGVEFAELGDRLLTHLAANADGATSRQ